MTVYFGAARKAERDRVVIKMRRRGMGAREIGAAVGCSESTVRNIIRLAEGRYGKHKAD